MRYIILILLCALTADAQMLRVKRRAAASPSNTWTIVQTQRVTSCTSPCSITLTQAATVGNAMVAAVLGSWAGSAAITFNGTVVNQDDASRSSQWTHPSSCNAYAATGRSVDIIYNLNIGNADTGLKFSFTNSGYGTNDVIVMEVSPSSTAATFDACVATSNASGTNPSGVGLTLTGTSDFVAQFIGSWGVTAISGSYGYTLFPSDGVNGGIAGKVNVNGTFSAPTWTSSSNITTAVAAIALR